MVALFTVGGIIVDTVVTADGLVGPLAMGGNAVYSAAGARLWLDSIGIVGRIPENYPNRFLDQLSKAGIDLSGIITVDEIVDEGEWFFYRPDGSRADHLHAPINATSTPAPGSRLSPAEREIWESKLHDRISGADFASFRRRNPVRMNDIPAEYLNARSAHLAANRPHHQIETAERLRSLGLTVSIDPGSNASELANDGLERLLGAASVFLPSEKELAVFSGGCPPEEGMLNLRQKGAGVQALKLGSRGSLILSVADGPWAIPAAPVQALDPTGAGDSYCGGFLAGLCLGGDPVTAACLATVSASFAVEDFGPFRLLGTSRRCAIERLHALVGTLGNDLASRVLSHLSQMELT